MTLAEKILREAGLEKDYEQAQIAQKYIEKVKELISTFPNKHCSYNPDLDFSAVDIGTMSFQFFGNRNIYSAAYALHGANRMKAAYDMRNNCTNFYGVEISFDEKKYKAKQPSLTIDFNEEEALHELTHFLDFKRSGYKGQKKIMAKLAPGKAQDLNKDKNGNVSRKALDKYYNNPYEMNAHFIEYVMPKMNAIIQNKSEIPTKFDAFKNEIFQNAELAGYYRNLSEENQKRFLKRIGVYYQSLKGFVAKEPDIKFDSNSTSLEVNQPILDKVFNKLKSLFSRKQAA